MAFVLKKLVGYFLMPLQASLTGLIVGLLLLRSGKWRRTGRILVVASVFWLLIASNKGIGSFLAWSLEGRYPPQPEFAQGSPVSQDLLACQAVVVLGGGHADAERLPAQNRLSAAALSRILEGTRIARALPTAPLWVTGPGVAADLPTHAHLLATVAMDLGIQKDRIHESPTGEDTETEAIALRNELGPRPIALVTSAWHMPRSVRLFQRAGFSVVACPTDFVARTNDDFRFSDYFAWDLSGLERTTKAVYEYIGLTWAKIRGRI